MSYIVHPNSSSTIFSSIGYFEPELSLIITDRNSIQLYSTEFELIKKKNYYEEILQIDKYERSDKSHGLVVLFRDAKISLIYYCNLTNDFITHGLKYYAEHKKFAGSQFFRLSTKSNCGFVKIDDETFAVFNLKRSRYLKESIIIKFKEVKKNLRNIIDVVFIDNFMPTICILHNPHFTNYTKGPMPLSVLTLSIDVKTMKALVINEQEVEPDSYKLVALSDSYFVISRDSITFFKNGSVFKIAHEVHNFDLKCKKITENQVIGKNSANGASNSEVLHGLEIDLDLNHQSPQNEEIGVVQRYLIDILNEESNAIFSLVDNNILIYADNEFYLLELIEDNIKIYSYKLNRLDMEAQIHFSVGSKISFSRFDAPGLPRASVAIHKNHIFYKNGFYILDFSHTEDSSANHEAYSASWNNKGKYKGATLEFKKLTAPPSQTTIRTIKLERSIRSDHFDLVLSYKNTTLKDVYTKIIYELNIFLLSNSSCTVIIKDKLQHTIDEGAISFKKVGKYILVFFPNQLRIFDENFENKIEIEANFDEVEYFGKWTFVLVGSALFIYEINLSILISRSIFDGKSKMTFQNVFRLISQFSDVTTFSISSNLVLFVENTIKVLTLTEFSFLYSIDIMDFCSVVKIESSAQAVKRDSVEENPIVEILLMESCKYILLRTVYNELIIYKRRGGVYLRIEHDKVLKFKPGFKSLFKIGQKVYVKSESPYLISFSPFSIHKSKFSIESISNKHGLCRNRIVVLSEKKQYERRRIEPVVSGELERYSSVLVKKHELFDLSYKEDSVIRNRRLITTLNLKDHPKNSILVTAEDSLFFKDAGEENPDAPKIEHDEFGARSLRFYLELSTKNSELINEYEFLPDEYISATKMLELNDLQSAGGKDEFLAVCTSFVKSEDGLFKGRLLVFEVVSVNPEIDKPWTDKKLKIICIENCKGPVLDCCEIRGNIAACVGTKVLIFEVDRNEGINAIAFHDLQILATKIRSAKNFLLLADINRGLNFFFFQSKPAKIELLATSEPFECTDLDFIISKDILSFVAYGDNRIRIFTYSPNHEMSQNGMTLVKQCEFYSSLSIPKIRYTDNRMIEMLYPRILTALKNTAGLNPRCITENISSTMLPCVKSPMYDFVFFDFLNFSISKQNDICAGLKCGRGEILNAIYEALKE